MPTPRDKKYAQSTSCDDDYYGLVPIVEELDLDGHDSFPTASSPRNGQNFL
jgi:hypothetical protein